ncbi:MAG TPA: polyprenyl synthetase family protein [Candidatus Ozemobacteraceae bacterium]|nr:polyprenyl synthetase family protein [Candidatus Ozemobacteraceae bacterium]
MTQASLTVSSDFSQTLKKLAGQVDDALQKWLPQPMPEVSAKLNEAMRYSALAGGKRIRPVLCLLVAEAAGLHSEAALRAGCAYELIHTYSLIHDDLPSMDNDDFRRGRPTNHKVYGEATAILAGDGLLTMAFGWLAELAGCGVTAEKIVKIIALAAEAAGHGGMVGGQMLDIAWEKQRAELPVLESIHRQKTGALIRAPILTGAILAGLADSHCKILDLYSGRIGLLFQIVDDILDVVGDAQSLGKTTGRDALLEKSTYPSLLGLDGARDYAARVHAEAVALVAQLPLTFSCLKEMADIIFFRKN